MSEPGWLKEFAGLDALEALFAEREPRVRAYLAEESRFERLRREAAELLERWPDPAARPPLFGLLVGVKDVFHVDGFETRAGSRLPPEALAGPEAACVTDLREAGALIVGKTVSTEFAYFAPGPTRNPWNEEHTPGGSSSGSAAAVAAELADLALGTQTIGSVIRPAAFCGVVGFKPTYGRISRQGLIPLAPSFDHVGLFAGSVGEVARAAPVLIPDWKNEESRPGRPRLGIPEGPYLERAAGEGLDHFRGTCGRLRAAGYEIEAVEVLADFEEVLARHHRVVAAEAARVHRGDFSDSFQVERRDWFGRFGDLYEARTAELIRRGEQVSDRQLELDLAERRDFRDSLTSAMDEYGIDLWISPPALGAAPRGLGSTGDPVMNVPWTQAGMPAVCLPAGRNAAGLPLGLQVAGRCGADEELLSWSVEIASLCGNGSVREERPTGTSYPSEGFQSLAGFAGGSAPLGPRGLRAPARAEMWPR
jgi:Asp-tRNA(Asn)/Glu-tRNA(Gln) amidotransferase A subunit family amidase